MSSPRLRQRCYPVPPPPSSLPLFADDARTKATWQRLGFAFTTTEELQRYGVTHHDLLHMDNTVQVWGGKGLLLCCAVLCWEAGKRMRCSLVCWHQGLLCAEGWGWVWEGVLWERGCEAAQQQGRERSRMSHVRRQTCTMLLACCYQCLLLATVAAITAD